MSAATGDLPPPESAATPTNHPGLKSLTLATSPTLISSSPVTDGTLSKATAMHRCSVVVTPTYASTSMSFFVALRWPRVSPRHPRTPLRLPESVAAPRTSHLFTVSRLHKSRRPLRAVRLKSTGVVMLPSQTSSTSCTSPRPHSSHISELKRTLSSRSQPRPVFFVASDSSLSNAELRDEMLHLFADLNAKRDV